MSYKLQNNTVKEMQEFNLTGNVVPISWFHFIKYDNGKPRTKAIMLLADILYWYRPTNVRDEHTGQFLRVEQKFKADMLQKQYGQYAELFGYSKNQVKSAIDYLVEEGYLHREFRNIKVMGRSVNNVMYLEPKVDKIKEITFDKVENIPSPNRNKEGGVIDVGTNTKTTTQTSTKNNNGHHQSAKVQPIIYAKTIADDECYSAIKYYNHRYYMINDKFLALKVNQWQQVKDKFEKVMDEQGLTVDDMKSVIDRYFCVVDSNDYNILHFISGDIIKHQLASLGLAHYSEVN